MPNQNHCMNIKQARLIVNAHKHNLLNSFCYNGIYVFIKQHENTTKINQKSRETEREREREMWLYEGHARCFRLVFKEGVSGPDGL